MVRAYIRNKEEEVCGRPGDWGNSFMFLVAMDIHMV